MITSNQILNTYFCFVVCGFMRIFSEFMNEIVKTLVDGTVESLNLFIHKMIQNIFVIHSNSKETIFTCFQVCSV